MSRQLLCFDILLHILHDNSVMFWITLDLSFYLDWYILAGVLWWWWCHGVQCKVPTKALSDTIHNSHEAPLPPNPAVSAFTNGHFTVTGDVTRPAWAVV